MNKIVEVLKKNILAFLPFLKTWYRDYLIKKSQKPFLNRTNADIFSEVYEKKLWGENPNDQSDFYSGTGSYGDIASEYIHCISSFIKDNNIATITDIGCGDFKIGSQIAERNTNLKYTACDVVPSLIERNKLKFANIPNVEFKVIDGAKDALPKSQLITIRQVLQHLSNSDVQSILLKTKAFPYVIISEHLFKEGLEKSYNKDKPSGPDIRLSEMSGVYIDKAPFNLKATEILRCREDIEGKEAYIISYLIVNS